MVYRWAWNCALVVAMCGVFVGNGRLSQAIAAEPPNGKAEASAFVSETLIKACSPFQNAQAAVVDASLLGSRLILKSKLSGLPSSGFTTSINLDELSDLQVVESTVILRCNQPSCIDERTDLNLPGSTRHRNDITFRCASNFGQRLKKALDVYMLDIPRKRSAF